MLQASHLSRVVLRRMPASSVHFLLRGDSAVEFLGVYFLNYCVTENSIPAGFCKGQQGSPHPN